MIAKDVLGIDIEIGCTVAYNRSGDLAKGVVSKIEVRRKYNRSYIYLEVTSELGISRISNTRGVMVLRDAQGRSTIY